MVFNIKLRSAIVAVLMVALLIPLSVLAQTDRSTRDVEAKNRVTTFFCDNLDNLRNRTRDKRTDRTKEVRARHSGRITDHKERKVDRIAKLNERRVAHNTARDDQYTALRERVQTGVQRDAVNDFRNTVEDLTAVRKQSIDEAIKVFEDAVEQLRIDSETAVDNLSDDVNATMDTIFDDAKDACNNGDNPSEVRAQLRTDFEVMRIDFKKRKSEYSFRADFKALVEVRRAAFADAKRVFKTGLEEAKSTLRETLSQQ